MSLEDTLAQLSAEYRIAEAEFDMSTMIELEEAMWRIEDALWLGDSS